MSTFNNSSSNSDESSKKEGLFENGFNDPFEILVSTKETDKNDKQINASTSSSQSTTNELFDASINQFKQNVPTQDLFSDNFLNESFTAFESNNPFNTQPLNQSVSSNQEMNPVSPKNQTSPTNSPNDNQTKLISSPQSSQDDDFDKITNLNDNTQTDLNSTNESDDHNRSNEETGDFATIAIQDQQNQAESVHNLEDNVSDFSKIKKSINEKQLYLASCLMNDAVCGYRSECDNDSKSLYLYSIYRHFYLQYLLYILVILHHCLAFVEELGLSREYAKYDNLTITFEFICLTYYALRLAHRASMLPAYKFTTDIKNLLLLLLICITLIDIITYLSIPAKYAYRWFIIGRPLFVINFAENRQIRRLIRNIRNTLPDILNVLILLFISISIYSLIAVKLFQNVELVSPNQIKAKNYLDFYYLLYVLVTTANNPELMMPAYHENKYYSLFFISFFILNLYLFMNIILAVIYNNFRKHLKNEVKSMLVTRKSSLIKSFEVIIRGNVMNLNESIPIFGDNEGLNADQFKLLMQSYFTYWKSSSTISIFRKNTMKNSNYLIQVYWKLLESNSLITWKEYQNLPDLLNMDMKVINLSKLREQSNSVRFPKLYNLIIAKLLIDLVKSKYFRYFFDTLIALNAFFVAFDLNYYQQIEIGLLLLFIIELALKIFTFGLKSFMSKYFNIFDSLVIGSSFLLILFGLWLNSKTMIYYGELVIILRVLRLCKWLKKIDRFNIVVRTITNLLPYISLYSILLLLLFYGYSIIGMQLFRNLITPEIINNDCTIIKTILNKTSSYTTTTKMKYCDLNFNTLSSSFITLFNLMVVNQWHVIADNYEVIVGSKFTRLYFVSFHLICVLILLNCFTGFVLEAFILEYLNNSGHQISDENNSELKKKIAQLGLECQQSILNLVSASNGYQERNTNLTLGQLIGLNELDQLDADHDLYEYSYNLKQQNMANLNEDNLDCIAKQNFSVITLSSESNFRVLIKENRTVEQLLFKMFKDELSKQI